MKKKWYRSSAVKAAALVVGVASLTAAAAGGAASAGIMSEGVLPFDKKEYLESRSFEQSMRHASFDVLIAESEKKLHGIKTGKRRGGSVGDPCR